MAFRAGPVPVQLRFDTGLAGERYVTEELWRLARLERCPLHPGGGCGLARHGSYARKTPAGTRIARWYCREGHCTFSLLPDHLAARFASTLADLEQVVEAAEAAPSRQACVDALRPDGVGLPGALRWLDRRVAAVGALLVAAVTLLPEALAGCAPTIAALRERLPPEAPATPTVAGASSTPPPVPTPATSSSAADPVLPRLRRMLGAHLQALRWPLGFAHRTVVIGAAARRRQQHPGPDPPPAPA